MVRLLAAQVLLQEVLAVLGVGLSDHLRVVVQVARKRLHICFVAHAWGQDVSVDDRLRIQRQIEIGRRD